MDCTFKTENGIFNYRVGAVIINGKKVLMATNLRESFYYSVGGRVKLGETLEDAVIREVKEETGIECEIEKMIAIHENFFKDNDSSSLVHELSAFFKIKSNEKLMNIQNGHRTTLGTAPDEYLEWVDLENTDNITIYPDFFKKVDLANTDEIKHFITK